MTNIIGTLNIIRAAKYYGCRLVVFASTSAVYAHDAKVPISHRARKSPESPYGLSKYTAEQYLLMNKSFQTSVLRFGNVYGPRQLPLGENQVIPRFLSHVYNNTDFSIYGSGNQRRDYVYVEDVAKAIETAIEYSLNGAGNVGTGIGTTTNDLVSKLCSITGYQEEIKHTEAKDERDVILDTDYVWWNADTDLQSGLEKTVGAWEK
jgi:UDP-glucose 4-epimerase